jgi:uncharacterized protein (DUF58 family)
VNVSRFSISRRFWGAATAGGLLLVAAAVLGRPLLFGGAAAVFALLLVRRLRFVRTVQRVRSTATVTQRPVKDRPTVDAPVTVDVSVELPKPVDADLVVGVETPLAGRQLTAGPAVTVAAGSREARGETTLVWDVAGRYTLETPTVTLRDPAGLFVATLPLGEQYVVTVDPPHVGRVALGRTGRELVEDAERKSKLNIQSGIEPEGIRPHVSGDSMRHIDWKTTARLGELHIREFNTEHGRSAALVIDARASMVDGPVGRTKLDYARHLALSIQEVARTQQLPLGLFVCDEAGPVVRIPPKLRSDAIRKQLRELDPRQRGSPNDTGSNRHGTGRIHARRSPIAASRIARILDGDASPFGTHLRPFFARGDRPSRIGMASNDPLYEVVTSLRDRQSGATVTYLFTDDAHRETLAESIRAATRNDGEVVVFLTPSVLFDTDALANPPVAYDRFVEFERFRRSIATYPRVSVYEVGPGDELAAVLSAAGGRRRRRATDTTRGTTAADAAGRHTAAPQSPATAIPGGDR